MWFIFGLIELRVGLAAFAMVVRSYTDCPVVIGKKLKVYRPNDTGAYHRLCMAMLVAGKLQQDDLRHGSMLKPAQGQPLRLNR